MQSIQEIEFKLPELTNKGNHRCLKTGTEVKLLRVVFQVLTSGLLILEAPSIVLHRLRFHSLVESWRNLVLNHQDPFHMIQTEIQIIKVPPTPEAVLSLLLLWLRADLSSEKVKVPSLVNKSASKRSKLWGRWGITSMVSNMNQLDQELIDKAKTNFQI